MSECFTNKYRQAHSTDTAINDFDVAGITDANAQEMAEIKKATQAAGTFMKAPNGQPTKLNERQWLQVRTQAFKEWFGEWENDSGNASRVVDENGEPLVMYHGSRNKFTKFMTKNQHITYKNPDTGQKNKFFWSVTGSLGEGAYFTPDKELAGQYVGDNGVLYEAFLNMCNPYRGHFDGLRKDMIKADYDGAQGVNLEEDIYMAIHPAQIKSATDNNGNFDTQSNDIRFQKKREDNLVAIHNLSENNLIHAAKMGGIAAPSIAIMDAAGSMEDYGEITLIGNTDMVDPKRNKNRVFNADVYSPRYPEVERYFAKDKEWYRLHDELLGLANHNGGNYKYIDREETLKGHATEAVIAAYLNEHNIPIPRDEYGNHPRKYTYSEENCRKVEAWMNDKLSKLDIRERIFTGFTPSGNRRYIPHTLDNVVKIMTEKIRDSEGFMYGTGNIRANAAKQFRTLKEIKDSRDRIVDKETIEKLKEEVNNEFDDLAEEMKAYYRYDPKKFDYYDYVAGAFSEHAQGDKDAFSIFTAIPEEMKQKANDYIDRLRNMPTEYFENKVQRAVGIGEFKVAVVPSSISDATRKTLEDAGLQIVEYNKNIKDDRKSKIAQASKENDLRFQFMGEQAMSAEASLKAVNAQFNTITRQDAEVLAGLLKKTGLAKKVVFGQKALAKVVEESNGTKILHTSDGEAYGAVKNGIVYFDDTRLNANTPIHEFGHLWNDVVRKNNPQLWAKIVKLTKKTPYFKDLLNNPAYANLKDDDARTDEAFAQAVGDEGARVFHNPTVGENFKNRFKHLMHKFWQC
ncbi:MAG: hypothetical protein LBG18_02400, partial [Mediterranea sp.]|nr:hypothetical protein [Mediterranea sp.]